MKSSNKIAVKGRNKKPIFPTQNTTRTPPLNPINTGLEKVNSQSAILCRNKKIRNTKKKRLTKQFLEYLKNISEIAEEQNLKVVPFSSHITTAGLHTLIAECERRNESLSTVIHQRYAKSLERRIKRKPVFFFALGYDDPLKAAKGKTRIQPQCYTGIHTHGFVLVTDLEHNGRTEEGQELRKAFKTFNGNVEEKTNSFIQQEVKVATASNLEFWQTKYTAEVSLQKQAEYLAVNALQFDRYYQKNEKPYSVSKAISGYNKGKETVIEPITIAETSEDFDEKEISDFEAASEKLNAPEPLTPAENDSLNDNDLEVFGAYLDEINAQRKRLDEELDDALNSL